MSFASDRFDFLGLDTPTAIVGGAVVPHIYLDAAATCLMPRPVWSTIGTYLETACANSHTHGSARGRATTAAIDRAKDLVHDLVNARATDGVVFVGSGSTGALNLLAQALIGGEGRALVSQMEHHSNMLPWMRAAGDRTYFFATLDDGTIDFASLSRALEPKDVDVVCVSAMSNVTGTINDIRRIATMAHNAGALLVVDGSQAAPHIKLDMAGDGIDFLVLSGHKLYAPGSPGVLIGNATKLRESAWVAGPVGGGIVKRVDLDEGVTLIEGPGALEAGTPDIPGIVGLGAAVLFVQDMGYSAIRAHEVTLTRLAIEELSKLQTCVVYGPTDVAQRGGIISFNLMGIPHGLVAAALCDYFAISVRNDCFCSQPFVRALLDAACNQKGVCAPVKEGQRGMVRASFGVWVTEEHVRKLVEAVTWIESHATELEGLYDNDSGKFTHKTFRPELPFNLDAAFARNLP